MTEQIGFITKNMLEIINKLTPPYDKLAHFYWGLIYSIIGNLIGGVLNFPLLIILLPLLLGIIKEIIDYKTHGKPEYLDIIFTVLPSLLIYFLIL